MLEAKDSSLTVGTQAPGKCSKVEAATLLYLMDHICSPQDSLRASFDELENDRLFSDHGYEKELSESIIVDDRSNKVFERVIPFLK
jgi:hypothetical protein